MTAPATASGTPAIRLGTILWVLAAAVFVALRLGTALNLPVAGPELVHLSGAWQARIGVDDQRFVPTLFQALSALLLRASDSEGPARLLALAATVTVPLAFWLLRDRLGEAGALIALALVAVDAPAIVLGASASAMGFDFALTVWLAAALLNRWRLGPGWAAVGFLIATAGPVALPLCFAGVALWGGRRTAIQWRTPAFLALGAGAGILATSFRFGMGWDGLRIPPLDLFAESFDERWSTATVAALSMLYVWPAIALGLAALGWRVWQWYNRARPALDPLLAAWPLFAIGWWLAALTSNGAVATAALTLPLAFVTGPAISEAANAARRADWRTAAPALLLAALFAGMAIAVVFDWADDGRVGPDNEVARAVIFGVAAALILAAIGTNVRARPALLAVPALTLMALLSGGANIAFVAEDDPLPSPYTGAQARALRDLALERVAERGGSIVIHPDFADALTWPFRDSGTVIVASRLPEGATVVLWPAREGRPEGFDIVEGQWALTRERIPPTSGVLRYLHWHFDRNTLADVPDGLAVYVRGGE